MFSKISDVEKCNILIGNLLGDGSYDNRGAATCDFFNT